MKKSLLFTLAASVMLCASIFTGCSDLPEEYYPSAETKAKAEAAKNSTKQPAVPEGATVIFDFSKATTLPEGAQTEQYNVKILELIDDNTFKDGKKALKVSSTSDWKLAFIPLANEVDITGKKLYIVAKGKTEYPEDAGNNGKVSFWVSSSTDSKENRTEAWLTLDDDSAYKTYEFDVSKADNKNTEKYYESSAIADVSALRQIGFWTRQAKPYEFQIAAIYAK